MFSKLKAIAIATLVSATFAQADGGDWIDIKMGVGNWSADAPSGKMGESPTNTIDYANDFNIQNGEAEYMWAEFQHFLPLIPNVRVEYASMPFAGKSTADFNFSGYVVKGNIDAVLNLDNVDAIFFYDMDFFDELLDVNYGVGAKVIAGTLDATVDVLGTLQTESIPVAGVAIYAYLNARIDLPLGFGFEYEYKKYPGGIDLGGAEMEFTASIVKVDYTLEVSIFQLGVEVGQRAMDLKLYLPNDGLYTESSLSGVFVGAFLKIGI